MTKQAPGASLIHGGAPPPCQMWVLSCWALWEGKFRSHCCIWSAAWVPVLFLGHSFHLLKGSTSLCNIFFLRSHARFFWRVPKFLFVGDDVTVATLPKTKACCHLTRQEVRCAFAGVWGETLPRWSVDRHQSLKIGHSASPAGVKKEVQAAASLPQRLYWYCCCT